MYCIAGRQHPPAKKKRKEEKRRFALFFLEMEIGFGGKDEGTVDKIVSHTFFWGGKGYLFHFQPKKKPFLQSFQHTFVRSVYSEIL